MSFARKNMLQIEPALGAGDCAFHSFVLGFFRKEVLDQLEERYEPNERLRAFILAAAQILRVNAQWALVKAAILRMREENKEELQRLFTPLMRHIAISRADNSLLHKQRTIEPLASAYNDYVNEKNGRVVRGVRDDIFKRHPFIVARFDQLYRNNKAEQDLLDWWEFGTENENKPGYDQFIENMRQPGQWAGDLELYQLATYFQVNLDVVRGDFTHHICIDNYGRMPIKSLVDDFNFNAEQIQRLSDNGIVNRYEPPAEELVLLPKTPELEQRVRGMNENVIAAWDHYYDPAPVITLSNQAGLHWNSTLPANAEMIIHAAAKEEANLKTETLKLADGMESKFDEMLEKAAREAKQTEIDAVEDLNDLYLPLTEKKIDYTHTNGSIFKVSKQEQIKLDGEYAKKLQIEEFNLYRRKN